MLWPLVIGSSKYWFVVALFKNILIFFLGRTIWPRTRIKAAKNKCSKKMFENRWHAKKVRKKVRRKKQFVDRHFRGNHKNKMEEFVLITNWASMFTISHQLVRNIINLVPAGARVKWCKRVYISLDIFKVKKHLGLMT